MVRYEMIDKYGKHTPIPDITSLQAILAADTNTLIARNMHLISIIHSENTRIDTIKNYYVDDWYFKPMSESWYPESENKLEALSSKYLQMKLSHTSGHMWVLRNNNSEKMQELSYRLHIIKDIDIHEYRKLFEDISIEKVINHQELSVLLSNSFSNSA